MSLTRTESEFMKDREEKLNDAERAVINASFNAIYEAAKIRGVKLANDDRAAALEAALVRFIIVSR